MYRTIVVPPSRKAILKPLATTNIGYMACPPQAGTFVLSLDSLICVLTKVLTYLVNISRILASKRPKTAAPQTNKLQLSFVPSDNKLPRCRVVKELLSALRGTAKYFA